MFKESHASAVSSRAGREISKKGDGKKDNELEVDPFYGEKNKCSTLAVMSLLAPVLDRLDLLPHQGAGMYSAAATNASG